MSRSRFLESAVPFSDSPWSQEWSVFAKTAAFASYASGPQKAGVPTPHALPTLILTDEAGNSIGGAPGNPVITVDDTTPHYATINMLGDKDFFQGTLEAGKTYQIGQYQTLSGPNGVPLPDAYLELYDAQGHLITTADGG